MTDLTATPNDPSAPGYWTMSRGNAARAFRAARRHSIMVRVLRVALPAAVVLVTLAVVLVTYFNPLRMLGKLPIDVGNLLISGTKITMEQPRMGVFTPDARAYELSADADARD